MFLRLVSALTAMLVALQLAACGVRGSLELPPDQKAQQAENAKTGPDGKPEHKGFILDGLLR
jgi:predicted small lipoprotein YifL